MKLPEEEAGQKRDAFNLSNHAPRGRSLPLWAIRESDLPGDRRAGCSRIPPTERQPLHG
jgi:hypothetical protein